MNTTNTQTKHTHTPGPWRVQKTGPRIEVRISDTACYAFSNRDEANARLIAAAPELYEALRKLTLGVEFALAESNFSERLWKLEMMFLGHTSELREARAAIKLAEEGREE